MSAVTVGAAWSADGAPMVPINDSDPVIRTEAINLLEPVEADTSVRQVLYSVSNSDDSPQIRNVSRQVLSRVPEIQ